MEDNKKRSLIEELGSTIGKPKNSDSRYEERTGSLTGKDPSLDDISHESRTEIAVQKDVFSKVSHNDWKAFVIKNTGLRVNDTLVFRELDGLTQTGQFQIKTVEYIIKDSGLKDGYVVAGWKSI
jgi:hypothetical protein